MTRLGAFNASGYEGAIRLKVPIPPEDWGVALRREWIADALGVCCASQELDALVVGGGRPEELSGAIIAAVRLRLPLLLTPPPDTPFCVGLAGLGFVPIAGQDPVELAAGMADSGGPTADSLVSGFSLANALRASLSVGGGAQTIVHLAAIAREAGEFGFSRMLRVLVPEIPQVTTVDSLWFRKHGAGALLATLEEELQQSATVTGWLADELPDPPEEPPEGELLGRTLLIEGRGSGTEAVVRTHSRENELLGRCLVFPSEDEAVREVVAGRVQRGTVVVVAGCGPRGAGLRRLDLLEEALEGAGISGRVTVFSDGLPPEGGRGNWVAPVSPETTEDGVIGKLRNEDLLRFKLAEKRIRTDVSYGDFSEREPMDSPTLTTSAGYAARFLRFALPALEGGGFD